MALNLSHPRAFTGSDPIVTSLAVAVVLVAGLLLLAALFGFQASGPSIEIVPDPAGTMISW